MGICPHAKKTWGTVCCCLPLALLALIVSILFLVDGAWEMANVIKSGKLGASDYIITFVISILKVICGFGGIVMLILKSAVMCNILAMMYKIYVMVAVAQFVVNWVLWILKMTGIYPSDQPKWKPNSDEITLMVYLSVTNIIYFCVAYWVISCFRSLHMVLKNEGTGWERKSYKDLKLDKALNAAESFDG